MITAVDTNVLFDVLLSHPIFGHSSKSALEKQESRGSLIICEIVYAELSALFREKTQLEEVLVTMNIRFVSSSSQALYEAGQIWKQYREKGRGPRRVLADFLIATHAREEADCLLTRDRGFYRDYFKNIEILEPKM